MSQLALSKISSPSITLLPLGKRPFLNPALALLISAFSSPYVLQNFAMVFQLSVNHFPIPIPETCLVFLVILKSNCWISAVLCLSAASPCSTPRPIVQLVSFRASQLVFHLLLTSLLTIGIERGVSHILYNREYTLVISKSKDFEISK